MVNDKWLEVMPQTTIENLSYVGSDHTPLLMEMIRANESHIKYFKFIHFWVENVTFMKTVQQCWEKEVSGNPMRRLHQKIKRVSATLSIWSKQEYGDIFAKVRKFEDTIRKFEEKLMTNNTETFRHILQQRNATYIRYLKMEECEEQIAQAACDYYQQIFTGQNDRIDERILQYIPTIVIAEQNETMQAMPTLEELRQVMFTMNTNSAAGPDGIGGKFYQACWSIIKEDFLAAVQSFFCGNNMPKFMTHACLVLLPKNEQPIRFRDLRPISLSNFTNKIISKLLSMRLATVLPLLISDNQSGFVRGRSITESIMLAQEITHGIKKPQIGNNVVIKLDMAKAYDRVSWSFICLAVRRFGFGELLIDLVWRIMSNNWYSIIINSHRHGFFHSTRGLKQGDPLSPALFILGAEVLSRLLNSLHQIPSYKGFFLEPKGPQINHLSFADDVIIFAAIDRHSLKVIMDRLGEYEHTSGQLINGEKSHFMIPDNTHLDIIKTIQEFVGWQARVLSFGGRITLIKHALQSVPLHTMAAISPPNTTIKYIDAIIAEFFWGKDLDKRKYHWVSLDTMCLPYNEGGLGIKRLTDICTSLQYKQWWSFRSKVSLWSQFLKSKYCQRAHPVVKKVDTGQSLMWKYMMKHKIKVEEYIGWQINSGNYSFWWDDWLEWGAIANYTSVVSSLNNATIAHFLIDGKWNVRKLRHQLPVRWLKVVDCIAKCNQEIRITLVMWKTPPINKYKLNTDGSALHNPGKIGGGGILRDDQGVIIYAFVVPFGEGTNNQAEMQAACYGLNCMAGAPPDERFKPPDPATGMNKQNMHPPIQESSSDSSYNSSQVREETIHTAIAEKKLDGTRTNISTEDSSQFHGHLPEVSSTFHRGIIGREASGNSAAIPMMNSGKLPQNEELRLSQNPHREGKQHFQELGQSSISHVEDFIKK
ncbi:uncharacterized protein LOC125843198 [Solanum stenotomum]|uniref:uncharacterized protein LOC125843198 n=1 Tax=Solanum stenotomum TaxID=172797 RepID=UPI0020D08683|nr:uncharacterized protein LOC125843198 [Solanum stenotomum]